MSRLNILREAFFPHMIECRFQNVFEKIKWRSEKGKAGPCRHRIGEDAATGFLSQTLKVHHFALMVLCHGICIILFGDQGQAPFCEIGLVQPIGPVIQCHHQVKCLWRTMDRAGADAKLDKTVTTPYP